MNPEEIIAAFLEVWETNPDNIFKTSGAVNGLDKLKETVKASQAESNEAFVEKLGAWCQDYPELTEVVVAVGEGKLKDAVPVASRKFDPANNIPAKQEEDKTLDNRYPEISKTLRERLPKDSEEEKENQ